MGRGCTLAKINFFGPLFLNFLDPLLFFPQEETLRLIHNSFSEFSGREPLLHAVNLLSASRHSSEPASPVSGRFPKHSGKDPGTGSKEEMFIWCLCESSV